MKSYDFLEAVAVFKGTANFSNRVVLLRIILTFLENLVMATMTFQLIVFGNGEGINGFWFSPSFMLL